MLARKDKAVLDLTKGVEGLFKKNKITYVKGKGEIKKRHRKWSSTSKGHA